MANPPSPLVAVADLDSLGERVAGLVEAARKGGLEWVLLRAKTSPESAVVGCARRIAASCPGLVVSVHASESLRKELGAGGVHFPSGRLPLFRGGTPERVVAGVSCHNAQEVYRAFEDGADYVFLSQIFAPLSKPAHEKLLGLSGLEEIAANARLPVYALGGMDADKLTGAAKAGAYGAAVSGALFMAADVCKKASELMNEAKRVF